jgi:hypothetical protein
VAHTPLSSLDSFRQTAMFAGCHQFFVGISALLRIMNYLAIFLARIYFIKIVQPQPDRLFQYVVAQEVLPAKYGIP